MSEEQFWHGNPRLTVSYREAHRLRMEERYAAEWRAGIYIMAAVASSEEHPYPTEPLFASPDVAAERREREERRRYEEMKTRFEARFAVINEKVAESETTDR